MKAPLLARLLGLFAFAIGIAGFFPIATAPADLTSPYLTIGRDYGFVAGLFATNAVLDGLHAAFGIWGILASFSFPRAVGFCRWTAWIFALLFLLGVIPITNTLFGVAPLYGHDIWLHLVIAIAAAFGGYGPASIPSPAGDDVLRPPG